MFRRIKALLGGQVEKDAGPPVTLIQRIMGTKGSDERRLLELAAESEAKGHLPQAVEALRKLAAHYAAEGAPKKHVAVLVRLSNLTPDDLELLRELEEVHRASGHAGDAESVARRRDELLRRAGRSQEARAPEAPVAHRPRAEVVRIPATNRTATEEEEESDRSEEDDTLPAPIPRPVVGVPDAPTTIDTHPPSAKEEGEHRTKKMDSGALELLRRLTKR